ncbi:hypothetical protein ACEQUB_p00498 (plasmid) [Ralstonia syzygii]
MSSPWVRMALVPHTLMLTDSGSWPVSLRWRASTSPASAVPMRQAACDGRLRGSTE